MSNLLSPHAPFQPFWRGKNPGVNEFSTLLSLLNTPAVILEPRQTHLFAANPEFLKLTAFSMNELSQVELKNLFPDLSRYEMIQPGEHHTRLNRHMREPMEVVIKPTALDPGGSWFLLSITPQNVAHQNSENQDWLEKYNQTMQNLFTLISQPDSSSCLSQMLEIGLVLTQARYLCVYQYNPLIQQYEKSASTENLDLPIFPNAIAASALPVDSEPEIWVPGKRVVHEFHRIARVGNLPYIGVSFLRQETAHLGILVIADSQGQPSPYLDKVMELLSSSFSSALYHHVLVQNLNQTLAQHHKAQIVREMAIQNTLEGILIVRKDLTIESLNPAAEMMLGYGESEVIGFPLENIIVGTDSLIPALKSALDGIPTHNLGNITLHRRNGQTFLGHIQTIPVTADDGLLAILVIIQDISENELIRVRTQQLEQRALLGEVTAIFAHEVRNPVNNISTGLQLLQMNTSPDNPQHETINRLQHDCNRLTHLMESVLSFSRPMEYKMDPVDLGMLLQRFLERWRPRFSKANVQAYFQMEPDILWVIGDARALEQVFTNLVNNAVQAMKTGGVLAVKMTNRQVSRGASPEVEVTVSDNGPGIPDEIREHIFEPFVTNNPQGTGLGLAITKRIINAHRGSISVNSFPGGTVFHVCLPACKPIGGVDS